VEKGILRLFVSINSLTVIAGQNNIRGILSMEMFFPPLVKDNIVETRVLLLLLV